MPATDAKSPVSDPRPLAVLLVSGGLDSCVSAAMAAATGCRLAFLHLNYGQRTEARELRAFHELADFFQAEVRLVVEMGHLKAIGGSSLTDPSLALAAMDLESPDIPSSYVPFRNANLLAVAVSWAEVLKAQSIYIGAVAEDASGYPDCRPEFYDAFQQVIQTGTRPDTTLRIETPIIHFSKAEIIQKGIDLNAPLALTWSCYQDEEQACGNCDSCGFRLRGFQQAGVEDPIPYRQRPRF